jgi:uncharacterized membrane protein YbaN (DUF454 family)
MVRPVFLSLGIVSFAVGFAGIFLPLVPTVPLMLLAAWCFGRSNPAWEQRLLDDPRFGPHIHAWRRNGSMPRSAKILSTALIGTSAALGFWMLDGVWRHVPAGFGALVLAWVWTRPDA